jgi:hypothetical protein
MECRALRLLNDEEYFVRMNFGGVCSLALNNNCSNMVLFAFVELELMHGDFSRIAPGDLTDEKAKSAAQCVLCGLRRCRVVELSVMDFALSNLLFKDGIFKVFKHFNNHLDW